MTASRLSLLHNPHEHFQTWSVLISQKAEPTCASKTYPAPSFNRSTVATSSLSLPRSDLSSVSFSAHHWSTLFVFFFIDFPFLPDVQRRDFKRLPRGKSLNFQKFKNFQNFQRRRRRRRLRLPQKSIPLQSRSFRDVQIHPRTHERALHTSIEQKDELRDDLERRERRKTR